MHVSGVVSLTRLSERKLPQAVNLYRSRCPASSRPSGLNANRARVVGQGAAVLAARRRYRERVIRDNARESGLSQAPFL